MMYGFQVAQILSCDVQAYKNFIGLKTSDDLPIKIPRHSFAIVNESTSNEPGKP